MQQIKKTDGYTIYQKKSGRYAVRGKDKKFLHGEEKTRILLAEGLIKKPEPKPPAPATETSEAESAEQPAS
jgi:hypothetical protein